MTAAHAQDVRKTEGDSGGGAIIVEESRPRLSVGSGIAWHLAAVAFVVAVYLAWWLIWQGIVSLLPGAFSDLPTSQLDLFTLLGGLVLWAVLAVLMALAFYFAAKRWPVPASAWVAVGVVGLFIAGMWLFTIASVQSGMAVAVDFARLGLVPLAAMSTASYVGVRRGSEMRAVSASAAFEQGHRADGAR